jgi:hypothetical protein
MIAKVLQRLFAAGGGFHNAASAEVDLFLRDDLNDLRLFLFKMILLFIDIKKGINQPPRPGNELCKDQIINCPGHPSFKRLIFHHISI